MRADHFYVAQSLQLTVEVTAVDTGVLQLGGKPGHLVNLVKCLHCREGLRDYEEPVLPLVDEETEKVLHCCQAPVTVQQGDPWSR